MMVDSKYHFNKRADLSVFSTKKKPSKVRVTGEQVHALEDGEQGQALEDAKAPETHTMW